jgi:CheY-like chemotaxis protein
MFLKISNHVLARCKVLVVDDDPPSLMVAMILLSNYGAKVITANNGQEALDLIASEPPTFVLSDLSMPVMSGWVLIEKLKQNSVTADLPVIALTSHAMTGDRERTIAAGFHNYLTKPLTPSTFMTDLLNVLAEIPALAAELHLPPKQSVKTVPPDSVPEAAPPAGNAASLAPTQGPTDTFSHDHKD